MRPYFGQVVGGNHKLARFTCVECGGGSRGEQVRTR